MSHPASTLKKNQGKEWRIEKSAPIKIILLMVCSQRAPTKNRSQITSKGNFNQPWPNTNNKTLSLTLPSSRMLARVWINYLPIRTLNKSTVRINKKLEESVISRKWLIPLQIKTCFHSKWLGLLRLKVLQARRTITISTLIKVQVTSTFTRISLKALR